MTFLKTRDYTGHSEASLDEAIVNALLKAGKHAQFEVIETRSSRRADNKRTYQVTLTTYPNSRKFNLTGMTVSC